MQVVMPQEPLLPTSTAAPDCWLAPSPSLPCDLTEECPAISSLNWDPSIWQESKTLAWVVYFSILSSHWWARRETTPQFNGKLSVCSPSFVFKSMPLMVHFLFLFLFFSFFPSFIFFRIPYSPWPYLIFPDPSLIVCESIFYQIHPINLPTYLCVWHICMCL